MLAGPVKQEFGISDAAMGLLLGPAFAIFYSSARGSRCAWLADRYLAARSLIAAGMVVWSAFTAATGLAQSSLPRRDHADRRRRRRSRRVPRPRTR